MGGSEALAAEPEPPTRERAEQEPETGSADHIEGQVHAGVDAGERDQRSDDPHDGLPRPRQ